MGSTHLADLCLLETVDEKNAIECLKLRYDEDQVYTWIGDVLLFVNPFKKLHVEQQLCQEYSRKSLLLLPPHIYAVARNLYDQLILSSENQCCLISGESGAGKSETSEAVTLQFLSQCRYSDRKLVEKIRKIDTVLNAFGNAKTILNDNATRHGKYLQLYFSKSGELSLAHVTEYLLEKTRVIQQRKDERTFHVFYYLFSGKSDEELLKHLLDLPTQHRYLKYGEGFGENETDWGKNYKQLLEALSTFGFIKEEISSVFGVLSAILSVGDLKFDMQDEKTGVYIENLDVLDKVATLLGIESDDLEMCLTCNMMAVKDDSISSFKNTNEANSCRDVFASTLYARLFGWLVNRMNSSLDTNDIKKKRSELLNVCFLDLFGFESLQKNSLEQLCINITNEQLQLHYTQHIFALENVEYKEEELDLPSIDHLDNKNLINLLLEQPHGIFALLEEESKCIQADDHTLLSKLNAQWNGHESFVILPSTLAPIFCIVHYNKKVPYLVDGFLEKNNDKFDIGLVDCLRGSKDILISTLFSSAVTKIGTLSLKTGTGKHYCCHGDLRPTYEKRRKYRPMIYRKRGLHKTLTSKIRKDHDRGYNTNKARYECGRSTGKRYMHNAALQYCTHLKSLTRPIVCNATQRKYNRTKMSCSGRNNVLQAEQFNCIDLPSTVNQCKGVLQTLTSKFSHNSRTKSKKTLTSRKSKTPLTMGAIFRNSLVDLMEKIMLCQAHFVRCIKPNRLKESSNFDVEVVQSQFKYLALEETIRVRQNGYPVRLSFKTFLERYCFLYFDFASTLEYTAANCQTLLEHCNLAGYKVGKTKIFLKLSHAAELKERLRRIVEKIIIVQKMVRGHLARVDFDFLNTTRKHEERNVGNLLVSQKCGSLQEKGTFEDVGVKLQIASKSSKMHENLILLNQADVKRHQTSSKGKYFDRLTLCREKLIFFNNQFVIFKKVLSEDVNVKVQEFAKMDEKENQQQKRKLTKTVSDIEHIKGTLNRQPVDSPNRKIPRSKTRTEPMIRNFVTSSMSAWCRVDCYERQYHVASFQMDQAVICVEGTHPVSDKNRIAFAAIPGRFDDPKVAKVKSCIGKGVQLHQDERQNLWATRLGKNPIFVRGHTLCPELVKLNGKLTQGVPMKILDNAAFKEYMREEVETNGGVTDELKEKVISRLKVCMSFIKDTVVDEETPCWFEIWLLKVKENVKRYLDNQQKRRDHEEKRRSGHFSHIHAVNTNDQTDTTRVTPQSTQHAPEMRRAKSGDQLKHSERRPRSHTALASTPGNDKHNSKLSRARPPSQQISKAPSLGDKQHSQPSMEKALSRLKAMNGDNIVSRRITKDELRREKSMELIRREKSMDVRLESRLLMEREYRNSMHRSGSDKQVTKKLKKGSPSQSPEQSLERNNSVESRNRDVAMEGVNMKPYNGSNTPSPHDTFNNRTSYINNNAAAPKEGMSYRQVFGLQSSDYLFNVTPPNYTRHRRFSDSDTESLQNFVHRIIPQDDGKNKVLQNIQPKKWLKKARRKSEDNPKRKVVAQLSNK